jgi:hypothetical protein
LERLLNSEISEEKIRYTQGTFVICDPSEVLWKVDHTEAYSFELHIRFIRSNDFARIISLMIN